MRGGEIDKDPEKVQAVKEWPVPTTVREVRSFLGLVGFYRKFIKDFAIKAKPLTNILKSTQFEEKFGVPFTKQAPVKLGEKELAAFEELKDALISSPVLVIFDPTKHTEVWADASWDNSCVGAVLMQDHGNGLQPVCFLSKVLNSPQSHYPTWEQELLALLLAMEAWRHYLLPISFQARTDHNGLKYLKTQKNLKERQWHWVNKFSEYQFDLQYRPGQNMVPPDALSRRPHTKASIDNLLRMKTDEEVEPTLTIEVPTKDGKTQKVLFTMSTRARTTESTEEPSQIPVTFNYDKDPDYKKINCDRDPKFVANFWKELWKRLKTRVAFSAPYHPKSNSYIEIQNKTFQENLRSFINARQDDWDEWLTPYEFAYNS